jgi:hypothetical protein
LLIFQDYPIGTLFRGRKTGQIYRLVRTIGSTFYLLLESEHKLYSINTIEDVSDFYELTTRTNFNKRCIDAIMEKDNDCVCY